jgi:hypothetical protein
MVSGLPGRSSGASEQRQPTAPSALIENFQNNI